MVRKGVALLSDKDDLTEEAGIKYEGGESAIVVIAASFPSTLQLQLLGPDSTTWIDVGSNLTANGVTIITLTEGTYRMFLNGGTATDVFVNLDQIPR